MPNQLKEWIGELRFVNSADVEFVDRYDGGGSAVLRTLNHTYRLNTPNNELLVCEFDQSGVGYSKTCLHRGPYTEKTWHTILAQIVGLEIQTARFEAERAMKQMCSTTPKDGAAA